MATKYMKISKSELFDESRQETGSLEISIEDLEESEIQRSQPTLKNISKFRKICQKVKKFEERFQLFQVLY